MLDRVRVGPSVSEGVDPQTFPAWTRDGCNESFDGGSRNGAWNSPASRTSRSAATYWSPESNGIRFWGFAE